MVGQVRALLGVSFIRALGPIIKAPPPWPNHLPNAPLQIISHWGLNFNIWRQGGGDANIPCITTSTFKLSEPFPLLDFDVTYLWGFVRLLCDKSPEHLMDLSFIETMPRLPNTFRYMSCREPFLKQSQPFWLLLQDFCWHFQCLNYLF